MRDISWRKQRGVALLMVLILLVMMSALAAKISQQFCRHLQKTHYQVSQQTLRWAIQRQQTVLENGLQKEASSESKGLSPNGDWAQPLETQGENYTVTSQVEDARTCFNVNSLIAEDSAAAKPADAPGALPEKPVKEQITEQLLIDSGVSATTAEEVYQQLVDDLDGDNLTAKQGQEQDAWASVIPARGPANQMMRTIDEIKQLPAFPLTAWAKASKLLCALPDTDGKVNVNTLTPEQAPLLAAIFTGTLNTDAAKRLIESRPEEGWDSLEAFSKVLETEYPQTKELMAQIQERIAVGSRDFRVSSTGSTDDLTLRVVSQLHVDSEAGKVITWQRRYRMAE
ncbi:type II secretion system minor pseudopilin GspK [Scandinavium sp. NPDC088450]|uniref:type II secretion system minor pseudopilin GspK n=1 Tax=Scandinavium sp. NPDC088450 TaxID=3364514 RepID=UPI00384C5B45